MSGAHGDAELAVRAALRSAMAHHDAGRFREAEALYRQVLEGAPDRPEALVLLAGVEHATGRHEEALAHVARAIRISPSIPNFHNLLGVVEEARGRRAEAAAAYRAALSIQPAFAPALFNLGNVLRAQGRNDEAIACYRRALTAEPRHAAALNNLGVALEDTGRVEEALAAYGHALALDERAECRANFARCAAAAPRLPADAAFRALVARAIAEAWARPADLARTAATLLGADGALAADPLGVALLANAQVCDAALERSLTQARRRLLESTSGADASGPGDALGFAVALARQCFLNDYVFACDAAEAARAQALRASIEAALAARGEVDALALSVLASYAPLGSLAGAAALLERTWPAALAALLAQQVVEPHAERELRERIPALTAIRSQVSRAVQRQYEESPYPRWVACAPVQPATLEAHLRELFPRAPIAPPATRAPLEILVAGCGTGQESIEVARRFPDARVLAVDLSRASLAYARRKSEELGVRNVEYAQADISELGDIGRDFDVISSVGVLHHLADPADGWRRLAGLLRPGGFMQVGLYSELARRDITRARAYIAERGFAPTPDGIRRARAALLAAPEFAAVTRLRDFHGTNECRDLLFHVQEHLFTLPQVAAAVALLGLDWIGLAVDRPTRRRYAARFPDDPDGSDPLRWDACERELPDLFAGMYLFWVRKPAEG